MKKIVLFDFDGVIADTFPVALEVFAQIFPGSNEEQIRKAFETNVNNWIVGQKIENKNYRKDLDFSIEYGRSMRDKANIFPHMSEMIERLFETYTLVIISSNVSVNLEEFLKKYKIRHYFSDILGTDTHDLKTEKIKIIFDKYKISHENCVFVTDSLGDIREASQMHIPSIAVSWGFNSVETLQKGHPLKIVYTPEELALSISNFLN